MTHDDVQDVALDWHDSREDLKRAWAQRRCFFRGAADRAHVRELVRVVRMRESVAWRNGITRKDLEESIQPLVLGGFL